MPLEATSGISSEHSRKRMLVPFLLVVALHLIAWRWLASPHGQEVAARIMNTVEVTLLPPPAPEVAPPVPPRPAMPQPRQAPQPVAVRKAPQPVAVPMPVQETSAPVHESTPTPPAPVVAAPPVTAPEPTIEQPRYNAAYLNNPAPTYPLAARRRNIEGKVLLRAEVQTDGSCSRTELKKSSGSDLLDEAALKAVANWRFVPAKRGNQAVVAWVEIPITFKLDN